MKTIDSIVAALAVDEEEQIEGVCAYNLGNSWLPLIAADEERYGQIKALATEIAAQTGKTIKMVRFTQRSEIEVIEGKKKQ